MRIALVYALVFAIGTMTAARAETLQIVNPLQLDPEVASKLSASDRSKVNASFARYQAAAKGNNPNGFLHGVPASTVNPREHLAASASMADPFSRAQVSVDAYVAESVTLQKAWFAASGHNLHPGQPIDLTVLTHMPGVHGGLATVPPPQSAQPAPAGTACSPVANPDDLVAAWTAIKNYHTTPNDVCSLPFGGIIKTIDQTHTPPMLPPFQGLSYSFGDPKRAEGIFSFTPKLDATNPSDTLDASVELGLDVIFVSQPKVSVADGKAELIVPKKGDVTTSVQISGAAFPDNSLFSTHQAYDGAFTYSGQPSKDYSFWTFEHSYAIGMWFGLSVPITVDASVTGHAALNYAVCGGADGFFAKASPSIKADAKASATAKFAVTGVSVTGDVTVQNNDSTFTSLATLVNYNHATYSAERLQAVYKPATYEAKLIVTGFIGFPFYKHWDVPVMDTHENPLPMPSYTADSQWRVQLVNRPEAKMLSPSTSQPTTACP